MDQTISFDKLDFGNSIVGFEQLRYFALEKVEGDNPFYVLRSNDEDNMEFIVISPFEVDRKYEVVISDDIKRKFQIDSPESVMVLCIVTLNKPFTDSTVNLIAPLVINVNNGMSGQIIMNGSVYQTRTRLSPSQREGE